MAYKSKITSCILLVSIITITVFILTNSLKDNEASNSSSMNITDMIISDSDAANESMNTLIRKMAHIVEFFVLGVATIAFAMHIRKNGEKHLFGYALFYVLAVAVADEHIQSFSDRTSTTDDIILDFCGGLIGFFSAWLIALVYRKIRQQSHKNNKIA